MIRSSASAEGAETFSRALEMLWRCLPRLNSRIWKLPAPSTIEIQRAVEQPGIQQVTLQRDFAAFDGG